MLLLAAISCMMVANPGTPDSKKKKKKTEKTETVDSVGDSVFVDSLGNEIKPKLKQADDTTQMTRCRKLYGNIIKWWMTVSASTVSPERNRVE